MVLAPKLQAIVAFAKRRGFVFQGSELYGGLAGTFDYGPLGVQLKKNIKDEWWKHFVLKRPNECVGVETSILLNPKVWKASGHVDSFTDPLSECPSCQKRVRADQYAEKLIGAQVSALQATVENLKSTGKWTCPHCGSADLSHAKDFNLLLSTGVGVGDNQQTCFLRPETSQGTFISLQQVFASTGRRKLPLGVASQGRVFRNEISPRDFIFRTREFEQCELQWICPATESHHWFDYWVNECTDFATSICGLGRVGHHSHGDHELAHYSLQTTDLTFDFPSIGDSEFWGISNRGSFDLEAHNIKLPASIASSTVHVIEPSLGVDRLFLAVLCNSLQIDENRTVMTLPAQIAPFEFAVLPVVVKNEKIMKMARDLVSHMVLNLGSRCDTDESSASIGKKYRRQDEIGTPYCITVDDDTVATGEATVRFRDSMEQIRLRLQDFSSKHELLKHLQSNEYSNVN